jgi:rhamnosyltransferase
VDNGSTAEELIPLRASRDQLNFRLIENKENLGIAEALNQGVRWAKGQTYPWVILFDQDSKITEGFVSLMLAAWAVHPRRKQLGSIHPRYVNPATGKEPIVLRAKDGGPVISLTSGALMPAWIFDRAGWFASEFFIDEVDREYSYRIRAAGYLLADAREAVLLHSAGQPQPRKLLGFTFTPMHHNPTRRYYMSRNRIALYKRYFPIFPRWILQSMNESLRETIKCFIGEQDRRRKLRSFLIGTWDGLIGKMGKREE